MFDRAHIISRDKDVLGGVPVFAGTRVPARSLLDYLREGHSLGEYLDDFPTVTPEQARRLLAIIPAI